MQRQGGDRRSKTRRGGEVILRIKKLLNTGPTTVTGAGEATVKSEEGGGDDPWHFLQGPPHQSSTPQRVGHWTKELRSPWCDVINKSSSVFVLF